MRIHNTLTPRPWIDQVPSIPIPAPCPSQRTQITAETRALGLIEIFDLYHQNLTRWGVLQKNLHYIREDVNKYILLGDILMHLPHPAGWANIC